MKMDIESWKVILAYLVVIAAFAYFFITYFNGNSQSDPQVIIAIVAALTQVLNYFFGSSQSSTKKDETIADMTKKVTK